MNKHRVYNTFRSWDGTELFHYDNLTNCLTIVQAAGRNTGVFIRHDEAANLLWRQFNRDMANKVPHTQRTHDPITYQEFVLHMNKAVAIIHKELESFNQSLINQQIAQ